MGTIKTATKKSPVAVKKAAPSKAAAPIVKKARPAGAKVVAKVEQVKTVGQFVQDEMVARGLVGATTIRVTKVDGTVVALTSLTEGNGLTPLSEFQPNTLSFVPAAKAS